MLRAVCEPSDLIVLEPVAGSLDLDHFIASMLGAETDQIRKARPVGTDVVRETHEPHLRVRGRNAEQRVFEQ
jgi:hypothetical protein